MVRFQERARRRIQIQEKLRYADDYDSAIKIISCLNASLRTTCVLDIEEYLHNQNIELLKFNRWWDQFDLKLLWQKIKLAGLG